VAGGSVPGVGEPEVPLAGGNVSAGVVRVGDTVRRPTGPWSPAVHALLVHLHEVGFDGAPRSMGFDECTTTPRRGTSSSAPTGGS
jgi:hypothetical protein